MDCLELKVCCHSGHTINLLACGNIYAKNGDLIVVREGLGLELLKLYPSILKKGKMVKKLSLRDIYYEHVKGGFPVDPIDEVFTKKIVEDRSMTKKRKRLKKAEVNESDDTTRG